MRRFFNFGKPAYQAPQVAPVPAGQDAKKSGVLINEQGRAIRVELIDHGNAEDIAAALGMLEIAKDVVKQTMSAWHAREQKRSAIITPSNGGLRVH